jgi:hypothetical protein
MNKSCRKSKTDINKDVKTDKNINKNKEEEDQERFYQNLKNKKKEIGGVPIAKSENNYSKDPFGDIPIYEDNKIVEDIIYNNSFYENLDLDIQHYSREDIFRLFKINHHNLSDKIMMNAKKIVLKTHPDKSKMESKFFLFFSSAYKKLFQIYEFQNKSNTKKEDTNEYVNHEKNKLLETFLKKADKKGFNHWFNEQFDKNKLEDPIEKGYGDWLKSNEDLTESTNIKKENINDEIEKHKKRVQSLTVYGGISDYYASTFGGTSLMEFNTNNFTSSSMFSNEGIGYTDLKQAYVESVIPVTEEDYKKINKFNNVEEFKRHRDSVNINPQTREEAMKQLYQRDKQLNDESTALAFHYAKQEEKMKKNEESFWSNLKQLTG